MLHGKVLYTLKATGNQVEVPWAGRVEFAFDEAGANPKMKFYQVYLVRRPRMTSWTYTRTFFPEIGTPANRHIQDTASQSGK